MSSNSLDTILNKITNEHLDINCRAMQNLLTKITNNLISLEQIDDRTGYKVMFCITQWLFMFLGNYQQHKYDPVLIINTLNLYLKCIDIFPPSAIQTLKKDFKLSSLFNDIGSISQELSNLCDQIQHGLSRNALESMSGRNTRNIPQVNNNPQEEAYSNRNTYAYNNNNNFAESYGPRINNEGTNTNYFNYTQPEGFRTNTNMRISNVNNTVNFNKIESLNTMAMNNNILSNTVSNTNANMNRNPNNYSFNESNSVGNNNTISNNKVENINANNKDLNSYAINSNSINKSPLVNPSLIILHENIGDSNSSRPMSKTMSKMSKDEIVNFNSYQTQNQLRNQKQNKQEPEPTFAKSVIPQQEEQFIFDLGINLKYGDSLQIYQSFNYFYTQILNDIPIEYLLHCDEIIKSICKITEECDFLEFGVLCYKIIDKMLSLVQKKISLELNNLNDLSSLEMTGPKTPLEINQDTSKLECFVYYILTSVLISMNNSITKLAFYIPLVEKSLNLLNQLIVVYPNYYEILYKVLLNFDKVVNNYKVKNIDIANFFIFLLKTYINMDNNVLLDLIENLDFDYEIEVIQFVKNIFFTVYNNNNSLVHTLCLNLLNKFESLKEDSDKINMFLIDYNNANLISKSIQMTQEMLNGNFERNLIIDNFYNVLLSLKFLNNSPSFNEYNSIFPNNSTPLIKALCDFYVENPENNYEKANDLLMKLLSFKTNDKVEISLSIYASILDELKVKGNIIYPLFLNRKILNILFNDLTNDNYKENILEILFILFNDLDDNKNYDNILKQFFLLLPSFSKNFKFSSLQNKIESSLSYEEIYFKYLRNLFSKNDSIRKNAINFFKNNSSGAELGQASLGPSSENEKFDTLYCIQTGENEILKVLNEINDKGNILVSKTNEFLPLLNMLISNKIDTNIKTNSLRQLILMIKNKNYKSYYLKDILNYIIKELEIDINKYDITTLGNYYLQLIKLLTLIVFVYLNEEIVQQILNPNNSLYKILINNLLSIALKDDSSHHLLSAFALVFINIYAFYYRNISNENNILIPTESDFNEALPVLKFFSTYYHINIVPTKYVENIFINENGDNFNINNSILNFSVTKNIIDFIHYMKNPLIKTYEPQSLANLIKNIKNSDLLGVLNLTTKFFEYNSIYYSDENDFSESLLQIMIFFKRIIPNSPQNKNIIMDFINILDIALSSDVTGKLLSNYYNIFFPFIPDYLIKIFHYISIEKEFINTLSDNIDNQNFVYELLQFICNNPSFFPFNNKDDLCLNILSKFLETYHNIFIFNSQTNFYRVKVGLIKFENIFFNNILSLNLGEKVYADKINSLVFFLSKYEPVITFNSYNYLLWCLKYISQLIKANKSIDIIQTKSYIFVKLLQSPFIEVKISALNILKSLFSKELFEKHGTILYDIYNAIQNVQSKILRINYFNFLIKSLEFILQHKSLDDLSDQFSNELLTMNAQIIEQTEVINLLNVVLSDKYYDSMYCAMVLKYFNICLNINLENEDYAKGIFFGFSFIDLLNDIITKENNNIKRVVNLDVENDGYMEARPFGAFCFYDSEKKDKECLNITLQSILNVKEGLNLLIRGLSLLTPEYYNKYKSNITDVLLNLINYGEFVVKSWNKWQIKNDIYHIKILQSYVIKFFSCVYFIFSSNLINNEDIFPINSLIYQRLNNICYDFMKFDSQQNIFEPTIKIMFTKLLPYLLSMNNLCKSKNSNLNTKNINTIYGNKDLLKKSESQKKNIESQLKNDGDTLLEVMNVIKKTYNIKFEVYGDNMKCQFEILDENIDVKNDLLNSLGSLLVQSQNCKKIFVRSKFINTFIDYLYQLQGFLLSYNINSDKKHISNNNINNISSNNSYNNKSQNISYDGNPFDITNRSKLNHTTTNYGNNKFMNSHLTNNNNESFNNNYTFFNNNNLSNYVINEFKNVLQLFQNLMYNFNKCEERKLLFIGDNNNFNDKDDKKNFLVLLYNIFYDTLKNNILFENYLKLLFNIIANSNGDLTNYLVLNLKSNKNYNLIELILSHFVTSINYMSTNPNFELYIKFLTCLFQYGPISNKLLKLKFEENIKSILMDLLQQRRVHENKNSVRLIGSLIKLFMSLSLNEQHARKLANKEFLMLLCELMMKIKNEEVIYYILFFFRNISFVSICKNIFVKNEKLIKMIFDMLVSESISIKIRFMLSHLIWILLYDNQTLKTALSKNEYLSEIKNLNIHLQKECDMSKFQKEFGDVMLREEQMKIREESNKSSDVKSKAGTDTKKEKEYLENTCLNLRKILHILEL